MSMLTPDRNIISEMSYERKQPLLQQQESRHLPVKLGRCGSCSEVELILQNANINIDNGCELEE